jgi:hypothetical protein
MNTEYEIALPNNLSIKVRLLDNIKEPQVEIIREPKVEQTNKSMYQSSSCIDFIREHYLKKELGLVKIVNTKLYTEYCISCFELEIRPFNKDAFYQSLKDVELIVNPGRYNGYRIFNFSLEKLKQIASKYNNFEEIEPENIRLLNDEIARLTQIINELQSRDEQRLKTILDLEDKINQLEEINIDEDTLDNINDLIAQL